MVRMIIVDVAPLAPGTTLAGEKLHDALAGSPAQERATELTKEPPSAGTVTVKVAEFPRTTDAEAGATESAKSTPVPLRLET